MPRGNPIDLTGKVFGRLTVKSRAGKDKNNLLLWTCVCSCGKEIVTRGQDLRRGSSKSCGCWKAEVTAKRNETHGMAGTRPHRIWKAMKSRCYNPCFPSYVDYGAKGVRICDRWLNSFENFWLDMQAGYSPELTIDRINVYGDYEPGNCRWASRKVQNRNKRNTRWVKTRLGTFSLADLAEIAKQKYGTVKNRLNRGDSGDSILRKGAAKGG